MFKRLTKLIFILGIIFLIIGIWLTIWNNIRSENIDLRNNEVLKAEEEYSKSNIKFRYDTMKLSVKDLEEKLSKEEKKNNEILQELLVKKAVIKHAEDLINVMTVYIDFMQELCDANGLIYPVLVIGD